VTVMPLPYLNCFSSNKSCGSRVCVV